MPRKGLIRRKTKQPTNQSRHNAESHIVLDKITWSNITVQTNDYHIEIVTWNLKIISIRKEYLKPYNSVQIICIWFGLIWFIGISATLVYLIHFYA